MKSRVFKPSKPVFLLCMLPGLIWYTVIVFVPILLALYYSMFDWPGGQIMTYIGFDNYAQIFQDIIFWQSFLNNIFLVVVCIIGQVGIAFIFTLMLNSKNVVLKGLHRTMSYFPSVLSAVVIGFIWSMIYDYRYGLLNAFFKAVGLEQYVQPWLNNTDLALFLVSLPLIWQYIGYYLIILLSSYSSIDSQILEMAEIDGATAFQRAIYITLPMLKNTLMVCLTLCISGNMKVFDHIYVMTSGGPGYTTSVMAMYAYNTSFVSYKMGYGSARSIAILILSLILVAGSRAGIMRLSREKE